MAVVRRRSAQPPLFAARPDQRGEFLEPRRCLALQDRQPRPASRVQARRHAAGRRRHALHDRRHAPRGRRARWRDRRAALGALGDRRRARRQLAAPALGPRRGLLDRRPRRRADSLRHDWLSAGRARRQDRVAHRRLRQRRHRRSEGRRGRRQGRADRFDGRRDRPSRHARDHSRRRRAHRLVDARRRHAEDAQQHEGQRARRSTSGPESGCGRSTRFRARASSATTPG